MEMNKDATSQMMGIVCITYQFRLKKRSSRNLCALNNEIFESLDRYSRHDLES